MGMWGGWNEGWMDGLGLSVVCCSTVAFTSLVPPSRSPLILCSVIHPSSPAFFPNFPSPIMREVISIHIGQGGIQIGNACWSVQGTRRQSTDRDGNGWGSSPQMQLIKQDDDRS